MTDNPEFAADTVREIIAGLRAVDEATASPPLNAADVGDILRGLVASVRKLADLPVFSREDRTSISRDSIRILLARYPREFSALLIRLRSVTPDEYPAVATSLRRQAVALGVSADSILSTATFRNVPAAATP